MNQGIVSTRSQSTSNDNLDDRIKLKIILANDILPQNTKEEIEVSINTGQDYVMSSLAMLCLGKDYYARSMICFRDYKRYHHIYL